MAIGHWRRYFGFVLAGVMVSGIGIIGLAVGPEDSPTGTTAMQPTTQNAVVHVDVTPEHVLNTVDPDTATGAWMDVLSKSQIDNLQKPEVIQGIKNLGWGSITYRTNSELRLAAWHWNEHGTWSDAENRRGYFAGSAEPVDSEPIKYGYSYSLPHRDFMTSGDSPLVAGPQSYWKSNPYLTSHFTGEPDTLHPQWVVIDMGMARPVDAIHIQWVHPYAVRYVVQHWIGDNNALDWDMGPNGVWKAFDHGTVTDGAGGDVHLKLADKPVTTRFVRVLMTESSNTAPPGNGPRSGDDIRNRVGYALQTLSMGTLDAAGAYSVVYPANGVEPGPGRRGRGGGAASRPAGGATRPAGAGGGGGGNAFPGSAQDTAGSFCASSIDPWHEPANQITGGQEMYNGMDSFFTSGLTMGHPALVPVTVLYGTPEDAANEVAYITKRGYPVLGIEIGEECDGKHMTPEDYGALYCQWADAIHKVAPNAKLGGPAFEGVNKDITLWPDDQGRVSWMGRFIDYLKSHGHLKDLAFMSFEHYPLMQNGIGPPNDWETLYIEPGLMRHVMQMWRDDGVPREVPLIISESGMTAGARGPGYLGVTGSAIWECDAFGTFFAEGGASFYRPAINGGAGGRGGGAPGGGEYGTPQYNPFTSPHLINFEWLQHGVPNQIHPASANLIDGEGRTVITSYAARRPDGTLSLMLINHDRHAAHEVHVVINDAKQVAHPLTGSVAIVQHCNTPSENKNTTLDAPADGAFTLPAGSITVIRGKMR